MFKIFIKTTLLIGSLSVGAYAQSANWKWATALPFNKSDNQYHVNSVVDKRGNTYVLSRLSTGLVVTYPNGSISGSGNTHVLSKIDKKGVIKWGINAPALAIDVIQSADLLQTMVVNNAGDIFYTHQNTNSIAATSNVFGFSIKPGAALVKIDSNGRIVSIKNIVRNTPIGSVTSQAAFCTALRPIGDSLIAIAGITSGQGFIGDQLAISNKTDFSRVFVGIIDTAAKPVYARYLSSTNIDLVESIKHLELDDSLNIYASGRVHWFAGAKVGANEKLENIPQLKNTGWVAFIAKYAYKSDLKWLKYIHTQNKNSEERSFDLNGLAVSSVDKKVYLVGNCIDTTYYNGNAFRSSKNTLDAFLLSIESTSGELNWANNIATKGFISANDDELFDVLLNENQQIVVGGNSGVPYIRSYNSDGTAYSELTQGGYFTLSANPKISYAGNNEYRWGALFNKTTTFGTYKVGTNTTPSVFIPAVASLQLSAPEITGIDEQNYNQSNFIFYPNPSSNQIKVNGNAEIFDLTGGKVAEGTDLIQISDLAKGIYVVKTKAGVAKLIKE